MYCAWLVHYQSRWSSMGTNQTATHNQHGRNSIDFPLHLRFIRSEAKTITSVSQQVNMNPGSVLGWLLPTLGKASVTHKLWLINHQLRRILKKTSVHHDNFFVLYIAAPAFAAQGKREGGDRISALHEVSPPCPSSPFFSNRTRSFVQLKSRDCTGALSIWVCQVPIEV